MASTRLRFAPLLLLPALAGCPSPDLRPIDPCTVTGVARRVQVDPVEKVDLLFVIDDSGSMTEEQASLTAQLPRLVNVLATGDLDGNGVAEFTAVEDLHVAVITTDMGTGGFRVPTCVEPSFGDDAIFRTAGATATAGCMASYPPIQSFRPDDGGDAAAFARDVACVAQAGTSGCGFEQQLDAAIKALVPSTDGITFAMGTRGHGDGANAGFLRPDSLLVVMLVTDEEDCSAADPGLFDRESTRYTGDLNLRCFMYPGAVHPVARYADALVSLRAEHPDRLIFAAIAGIPVDLSIPTGDNYDEILADPRMREIVDTAAMTPRLVPSCDVPGRGVAFPPRRIVALARELQAREAVGIVQSICQADFTPALNAVLLKIADVLRGACLPRPLTRDDQGRVTCDVVQVLPEAGEVTRCDQLVERGVDAEPVRLEDGRQVCRVRQLSAPGGTVEPGEGWYYDDFSDDVVTRCQTADRLPQRISFTPQGTPPAGAEVRLECLQSGGSIVAPEPIPCRSDADCPSALVCDVGDVRGTGSVCVSPTCGVGNGPGR